MPKINGSSNEATKPRLKAVIAEMSDKELSAFRDRFEPTGVKYRLANEVLRLRKSRLVVKEVA